MLKKCNKDKGTSGRMTMGRKEVNEAESDAGKSCPYNASAMDVAEHIGGPYSWVNVPFLLSLAFSSIKKTACNCLKVFAHSHQSDSSGYGNISRSSYFSHR